MIKSVIIMKERRGLGQFVSKDAHVIFVGTKKQAEEYVDELNRKSTDNNYYIKRVKITAANI